MLLCVNTQVTSQGDFLSGWVTFTLHLVCHSWLTVWRGKLFYTIKM